MTKIALCGVFLGVVSLSAQDPVTAEKKIAEFKMLSGGIDVLGGQMISGKTVTGAPYSAQAVNESVQELADGNKITHTNTTTIYRDSQGRERREESFGPSDAQLRTVFISDPVDGVNYTLEPQSKVARKNMVHTFSFNTAAPPPAGMKAAEEGAARAGRIAKTESQTMMITSDVGGAISISRQEFSSSKVDTKTENLGMQVIEGVSAEGTRTTMTIPAGQIGNSQPIVTVSERWYSPDLKTVVMTKRSDPRTGTTTYKLTNINRSEPAATLFQVPSDYTVTEPDMMIRRKFPREEQQ